MLLGNDLDNFHNFFHLLLVLWIIHVVLSLMSRLVHIFSSTMLSFVSTSSLTVFVFPQVRQSGCCRCFASRTQAPHSRIIGSTKLRIVRQTHPSLPSAPLRSIRLQSTNHRFIPNLPDLQSTNRRLTTRFHHLILKLIRLLFQVRSSRESR